MCKKMRLQIQQLTLDCDLVIQTPDFTELKTTFHGLKNKLQVLLGNV